MGEARKGGGDTENKRGTHPGGGGARGGEFVRDGRGEEGAWIQ